MKHAEKSVGLIGSLVARAAEVWRVPEERIYSKSRFLAHVRPRFAVAYVAKLNGYSLIRIGQRLGNRDHATIMNAIARAKEMIESDERFAEGVRILMGQADDWSRPDIPEELARLVREAEIEAAIARNMRNMERWLASEEVVV